GMGWGESGARRREIAGVDRHAGAAPSKFGPRTRPALRWGMPEPLVIAMIVFALLGVALLVAALIALRKHRWIPTGIALLLAASFLAVAALAATLGVAMQGYRALTREVVAATVVTRPTGPERFSATLTFPDGRREHYEITGNALYIDAHIVKWHPRAN